jgi:hypothetical protein
MNLHPQQSDPTTTKAKNALEADMLIRQIDRQGFEFLTWS